MSREFVKCPRHGHERQDYYLLCPHVADQSAPATQNVASPVVNGVQVLHTVIMCAACLVGDWTTYTAMCVKCFAERRQ